VDPLADATCAIVRLYARLDAWISRAVDSIAKTLAAR